MTAKHGLSENPDLSEVLRLAMGTHLSGVCVAMPGKIEKYDASTGKANVKPLLKKTIVATDGSETVETIPVLQDVPVVFPRGGGFFIHFPLEPGDGVLLVFADRSIDEWTVSSGKVDAAPGLLREHDLSDAIAIPGLFPFTRAIRATLSQDAVFGKENGVQLRATGQAMEVTTGGAPSATDFVVLVNKFIIAFNAHVHATAGVGAPSVPTTPLIPSMISSTNLKAD